MIASTMVEHINEKLNSLTKGKNPNFGANEPAAEVPTEGILVVLTKGKNMESFASYDEILASSTVLGKDDVDIFTVEGKTINVINIPYSETISINKGTATGFAIVKVESSNLIQADITGSDGTSLKDVKDSIQSLNTILQDCKSLLTDIKTNTTPTTTP